MTAVQEARVRRVPVDRRVGGDHALAVGDAVSLAPLPARRAVAQLTGLEHGPARSSRLLFRRAVAIAGLVALVAAAALPVIIHVLSLSV